MSENFLVIDTETTGLHFIKDYPFGFAYKNINNANYLEMKHGVRLLNTLIEKADVLIFHNAKFDLHMLIQAGISWPLLKSKDIFCTHVASVLCNEHRFSHSLDALGEEFFNIGKTDICKEVREHIGNKRLSKSKCMGMLKEMPFSIVAEYAMRDVEITYRLWVKFKENLKDEEVENIFALEMDLVKTLIQIERRGIDVDEKELKKALEIYQKSVNTSQRAVNDLAGFDLNTSSHLQMTEAFENLGIHPPFNRETGRPTFAKKALEGLSGPLPKAVLKLRHARKLLEGFLIPMKDFIIDGKLYTNFNAVKSDDYGTVTGRLSSSSPNMQQLPKRNADTFKVMRSLFKAPEGYDWICGDWEQFEFRIFAHYSRDLTLIGEYIKNPNIDFHTLVAEMAGIERFKAKTINLGLSFGMGATRLAKELNLPTKHNENNIEVPGEEAQELFELYHERFPSVKSTLNRIVSKAGKKKHIRTILKRKLRFPESKFSYKAGAYLFQGSAADLMKKKAIELNDAIKPFGAKLILLVHDEYNIICPKEHTEKVKEIYTQVVQDVPELRVPVLGNVKHGKNWYEAS